jgi:hypothetical protein
METVTPGRPLPAEEPASPALRVAIEAYLRGEEADETLRAQLLWKRAESEMELSPIR